MQTHTHTPCLHDCVQWKSFSPNDGIPPSPLNPLTPFLLPSPILYCISQAFPIMGFIPRPVTSGGRPAPLPTMAPWGLRRLRCCKASTLHLPATLPCSTFTARISLRAQVCMVRFCRRPFKSFYLFVCFISFLFLALHWFLTCWLARHLFSSLGVHLRVLRDMNTCIWSFASRCTACWLLFHVFI